MSAESKTGSTSEKKEGLSVITSHEKRSKKSTPPKSPLMRSGVNWSLLRSPKTPDRLKAPVSLDPRIVARHDSPKGFREEEELGKLEDFRLDGGTRRFDDDQVFDTSIKKIFIYGSLRPDLSESKLLSIWKDVCEVEWKIAHVSNAFLYRSEKDSTAQAMYCSMQNKMVLAASHHHRPFVVGCLITCKNEDEEKEFVGKFPEIDIMRNAPLLCKRIVVDVCCMEDDSYSRAYFYNFRSIVASLFDGKNMLALEQEEMKKLVTPIYSGDWSSPEPPWICFNCTNVCESCDLSCPECSLPRSKNSLPAATLWSREDEEEEKDDDDDDKKKKNTHILPVAYAFDSRMELHEECDPSDPFEVHPERPVRIRSIFEHLRAVGLLGRLIRCPARDASKNELLTCHTEDHIQRVMDSIKETPPQSFNWRDVYVCKNSAMSAVLSAGTTVALTEMILHGTVRSAVAIVRPPGHHAEENVCMGFCFFNNVAVAAHAAKARGVKRILILDWDVHHGNATQHMFESDPDVLYISIHRHPWYPNTGSPDGVGIGEGAGKSVNIGWINGGMGDAEYLAAFYAVIMPIAINFEPELVIISAGFDAAMGDPLGGCCVTPSGYAHMTSMLKTLAKGRVLVVLEGGYNLRSLAYSTEACVRVLMGEDDMPPASSVEPSCVGLACISRTIQAQAPYWRCLRLARHFYGSTKRSPMHNMSALSTLQPRKRPRMEEEEEEKRVVIQEEQQQEKMVSPSIRPMKLETIGLFCEDG